jgi:hypothetical protein
VAFLLFVPICIGRELLDRACVPRQLQHDVVSFVLGLGVCWTGASLARRAAKVGWRRIVGAVKRLPIRAILQGMETMV